MSTDNCAGVESCACGKGQKYVLVDGIDFNTKIKTHTHSNNKLLARTAKKEAYTYVQYSGVFSYGFCVVLDGST